MRTEDADRRAAEELIAQLVLPRPWSMQQLLADAALQRGVAIEVGTLTVAQQPKLAAAVTGVWVPRPDRDLIFVSELVAADQVETVLAHELGHVLMWRSGAGVGRRYLGRSYSMLPASVLESLSWRLCSARSAYVTPEERRAEWFATLLMAEAAQRRSVTLRPGAPVRAGEAANRIAAMLRFEV